MTGAYIINYGIISAIGNNAVQNLSSLKEGKQGISYPEILKSAHQLPVGEIKLTNEQLAELINAPATWPRTALLSLWAAREAWQPLAARSKNLRIGFISANTVGGMDLSERYYADFRNNAVAADKNLIRHHECGAITELTLRALGLNCWNTTISTACSSSANSIMMAARLLKQNKLDIVIAGWADALSKFTLNGFNSLMILDKEYCRPFDRDRNGLNIGEGAAYLVLANKKAAGQLGVEPVAMVTGYANANDAHHQTASSPDGKGNKLAMMEALETAGLQPGQIDYINLHGTGTANNDSSEGIAVRDIFTGGVPPASSTKAFTGHTLGAAGAIEAVFSTMAIREQIVFPQLRLKNPIPDLGWEPVKDIQYGRPVRHVLSNSFGFGGNCSTIIISKM